MGISPVLHKWFGRFSGRASFGGTRRVEPLSPLGLGFCTLRHFRTPLRILDRVFADGGDLKSLDLPGMPPFLFVRDPELIRIVTLETANGGAFDRDTLPTQGIARVVGERNLLYAQGDIWKQHRSAAAKVFGAGAVQTPGIYRDMERTILRAVKPQLDEIEARVRSSPTGACRMRLDPHVRAVMLNVLVNVLFGSAVPHQELRDRYLPAIENVIRYILIDTVANRLRLPVFRLPSLGGWHRRLKRDRLTFEELVERVIRTRSEGAGFWPLLAGGVPEEAVRSNVRVFLAGALEATASYICWTLSHLARHPAARAEAAAEARASAELSPEAGENAGYLRKVLAESLRLNNALYFLPRVAKRAATVTTAKGTLCIPADTHLILATWHANRSETHWGAAATRYPATDFVPERWDVENMAACGRSARDNLHFGFGHGPRVCIGKHFSEAEAFVCLTLFLRRFEFRAMQAGMGADSGVSSRPGDLVDVELSLRD